MLRKNTELEIPQDNPFLNDELERESIIFRLTNLIGTITQPFVISVEAPWGAGKTTFLRMWKQYLENEKYRVIYFNAWETDFSDDPLVSFIGELDEALNEIQEDLGDRAEHVQELWDKTKKIGAGVLKRAIPLVVQIGTAGILRQQDVEGLVEHSNEISSLFASVAEEKLQDYGKEKEGIKQFRASLAEIAQLVVEDDATKAPLVFIIDELDRCKPTYAIALLERIKHLFAVEGIIFILAMDRDQLEHSIKSVYGIGMDAGGYLKRFIDFSIKIPPDNSSNYAYYLFKKYKLDSVIQQNNAVQQFLDTTEFFFSQWEFSLRDQEQVYTELNIFARTINSKREKENIYLLVFLVSLKHFSIEHFNMILTGDLFEIEKIMKLIELPEDKSERRKFYRYKAGIEANLIFYRVNSNDAREKILSDYRGLIPEMSINSQSISFDPQQEYAQSILNKYKLVMNHPFSELNFLNHFSNMINEIEVRKS